MADEKKLKVVQTSVVNLRPENTKAQPGGWLSSGRKRVADSRERLGYSHASYASSIYETPSSHYSFYKEHRALMPSQYWSLYKSTPDVRACIDSIVRRIATWDWYIKPTVDPRDKDRYQELTAEAERIRAFLEVPSENGTTWQEMMTAMVTDLLIYDAGVLEIVKDEDGSLRELVCFLGSEWFPVTDEHGRLLRYDQNAENEKYPTMSLPPEDICYFQLFHNTRANLGLPLLESIINECVTTILASDHAMMALDADEIPPGLLVLGGVAGPAAERARADLQAMRGKDHSIRVITSPQPAGIEAKWVELRHTVKDLELRQVVEQMRRTIWRVFGVTPTELGETSGVPRAAAEVQMDVASSHLITPILELVQARINAQIIPRISDFNADIQFSFDRTAPATAGEKFALAQSRDLLLRNGVLTVNEVRAELGYMPIDGGDVAMMTTSYGPMPLNMVAQGVAMTDTPAVASTIESGETLVEDGEARTEKKNVRVEIEHSRTDCGGCPTCDAEERDSERWPDKDDWKRILRDKSVDEWLPSHWQTEGKFKGFRTLNLNSLATVVAEYSKAATELYVETAEEVSAIVASAFGSKGYMSISDSVVAQRRVNDAFDAMVAKWKMLSTPFYTKATIMGKETAEKWTGEFAEYDATEAAFAYQDDAIGWLEQEQGLVGTLRQDMSQILLNVMSTRNRIDDLDQLDGPEKTIKVVDKTFEAKSWRIDNWTGKLVPLSTSALATSLALSETTQKPEAPASALPAMEVDPADADLFAGPVEWMYEWVAASGDNCITCAYEGGTEYRELSQATVLPGQGTVCGARCRCVLVLWTKEEVARNQAVRLSDLPPNPPDAVAPIPTQPLPFSS